MLKDLDWNSSPKKSQAYERKEASWRRMLIVQPAVTTLKVMRPSRSKREDRLTVVSGLNMALVAIRKTFTASVDLIVMIRRGPKPDHMVSGLTGSVRSQCSIIYMNSFSTCESILSSGSRA